MTTLTDAPVAPVDLDAGPRWPSQTGALRPPVAARACIAWSTTPASGSSCPMATLGRPGRPSTCRPRTLLHPTRSRRPDRLR